MTSAELPPLPARRRGRLRCPDVQILTTDATTWPLPTDVTCVFLYNSFTGHLLDEVLGQIRASLQRRFRPLKIIYVQPVIDRDVLAECAWLARRGELSAGYWDHIRTVVYEPDPALFERWESGAAVIDDAHNRADSISADELTRNPNCVGMAGLVSLHLKGIWEMEFGLSEFIIANKRHLFSDIAVIARWSSSGKPSSSARGNG